MSVHHLTGTALDVDVSEIRAALRPMAFPVYVDDVLAALVQGHAPSRLLWRVVGLPRTQRYYSLDDLCDDVARGSGPGAVPSTAT